MQRLLFVMLFSSMLSADEIKNEEMPTISVEEMGSVLLKGDAVSAQVIEPVVVYPIEDFIRIDR